METRHALCDRAELAKTLGLVQPGKATFTGAFQEGQARAPAGHSAGYGTSSIDCHHAYGDRPKEEHRCQAGCADQTPSTVPRTVVPPQPIHAKRLKAYI